jgi:hypothetical protein
MDAREPLPSRLAPPRGQFDGAFSMSVIEHIEPDPGGDCLALAHIADAVCSGGPVVVSVPVDAQARSEYLKTEMYGRKATDERGAFFQRVYDAPALRALLAEVPTLALEQCVIIEWPDHPLLRIQPRFPTAVGFAGPSFAFLANRFAVSAPAPHIPEIHRPGDAILKLVRAPRE